MRIGECLRVCLTRPWSRARFALETHQLWWLGEPEREAAL